MSLSTQLEGRLDAGSLVGSFTTSLRGHTDGVGAIDIQVDASVGGQASAHAQSAQLSGFGPAIAEVVERIQPLLARLPVANDVMGPVNAALTTFEGIATGKLLTDLTAAVAAIKAEVEGTGEGLPALLVRVLDVLGANPATAGIGQLARALAGAVRLPSMPEPIVRVRDLIAALDALTRIVGGEMSVETVLAEGERLTTLVARQLDRDDIERLVAAATVAVDGGGLAARLQALQPDQTADIDAAVIAIRHARTAVERLIDALATGMGLGEATLLFLDVDTMQREVDLGLGLIRDADVAPIRRSVADGVGWIRPHLDRLNLDAVPALTLDALLTQVEGAVGNVAAGISAIDTVAAVRPLADALARLADVARTVADALESVVRDVRLAIGTIRDIVASLPIGAIADAIRTALSPITAAVDFLKTTIGAIAGGMHAAAEGAMGVLHTIEQSIDGFIAQVDALFGVAKTFIDDLHLDQVLGTVADKVREFADLISRARMKPYFDTAVDVIGTTADVVGAIPFDLLPDSMKADVDAAIKPVKDVDIEAFAVELEGVLQITPEGTFALRDDITSGLQQIQQKYDAVIQTIRDHHPRKYLQQLDDELEKLAQKIQDIEPGITLGPLRDAVEQVKGAITGFDLVAQLEPVQAVFRQILAAVDQYNPATLLAPVEARLDELRGQFVTALKIDRWVSTLTDLRAQGLAKIDALDPARHLAEITQTVDDAHRALRALPAGSVLAPLGQVVCTLLAATRLRLHPDSFLPFTDWLRASSPTAASTHLNARTQAIGDAVAATRASVAAIDLAAIGGRLAASVRALGVAVAAGRAQDDELRVRLEAPLVDFDPSASFLALAGNRVRYLALLDGAATAGAALRRAGFSIADDGLARLRDAFGPARVFGELYRTALGKVGIRDLDRGLRGVVDDLLSVATPTRLGGLASPLVVAIRDRLRALIDAVLAPVIDGATQLERAVATIDLTPIVQSIQEVVDEAKQQIEQLSPTALLAEPIAAFQGLQDELRGFDPFGDLIALLDELKAVIRRLTGDPPAVTEGRVEGKLKAERLLKVPLEIVDDLIAAFAALDLEHLLTPILDALDLLAHEIDEGLDRTVVSFKHLQDALPGGGGGSSGSVSGSVSVN